MKCHHCHPVKIEPLWVVTSLFFTCYWLVNPFGSISDFDGNFT